MQANLNGVTLHQDPTGLEYFRNRDGKMIEFHESEVAPSGYALRSGEWKIVVPHCDSSQKASTNDSAMVRSGAEGGGVDQFRRFLSRRPWTVCARCSTFRQTHLRQPTSTTPTLEMHKELFWWTLPSSTTLLATAFNVSRNSAAPLQLCQGLAGGLLTPMQSKQSKNANTFRPTVINVDIY